jgi:hypothetical protein
MTTPYSTANAAALRATINSTCIISPYPNFSSKYYLSHTEFKTSVKQKQLRITHVNKKSATKRYTHL